MENEDNSDVIEVATKDDQAGAEEAQAEAAEESQSEETADAPKEKLTYEEKLARAKTPEEKFAIANAEANKNRRLLSKTQKPAQPAQGATAKPQTSSPSPVDVDERILKGNGMPDELLAELKEIAAMPRNKGKGLIELQTDHLFVAVKEKFDQEQKERKASVGASRGSGSSKPKLTFTTPGITPEQHRELWERENGR